MSLILTSLTLWDTHWRSDSSFCSCGWTNSDTNTRRSLKVYGFIKSLFPYEGKEWDFLYTPRPLVCFCSTNERRQWCADDQSDQWIRNTEMDTCVHTHEIRQSLLIHETPLCDSHSPHGPLGSDQDSGLDRLPENPVKHTHTHSVWAQRPVVSRSRSHGSLRSALSPQRQLPHLHPSVRRFLQRHTWLKHTHTCGRQRCDTAERSDASARLRSFCCGTNSIRDASTFRNTPALSALEVRVSHTERNVRRYWPVSH